MLSEDNNAPRKYMQASMSQHEFDIERKKLWPSFYIRPRPHIPESPDLVTFLERAALALGEPVSELTGKSRKQVISRKRQAVYHAMRAVKGMSYPQIARIMNRDHSTVIHGIKQSEYLVTRDEGHRNIVNALEMVA